MIGYFAAGPVEEDKLINRHLNLGSAFPPHIVYPKSERLIFVSLAVNSLAPRVKRLPWRGGVDPLRLRDRSLSVRAISGCGEAG